MTMTRAEFEALYRQCAAEILGYLRRRGAGQDAADLLADVFLTAWRRREDLPASELRRAWLYGTARRLLLAQSREARPDSAGRSTELWTVDRSAPSDRPGAEVVRAVLAELGDFDRDLLTMTVWEHLSVVEAGAVLGLNPSAARVRLHRVRRRLAADPRIAALIRSPAPGRALLNVGQVPT